LKAAVLHGTREPLVVEDVEIAAPVGREVLVRTVAAGLCHSDLLFWYGEWAHPMPTILGHEVAGIVEAVGPEVSYVRPGDHIIGCAGGPCYTCQYCVIGRPILCEARQHSRGENERPRLSQSSVAIHQYGQLSAFAEQMVIHENATVKIPAEIPLHLASVVGCGVATGLGAVFNTARVEPGANVVVIGCGGVGLNVVQGARIAGASKIIGVDIVNGKLDRATGLGATHVVDTAREGAVEAVRRLTERGAEYVFEVTGVQELAEQAVEMLAPGGTLTLVGIPPEGARMEFEPAKFIPLEQRILGTSVGSLRPRVDIPRYLRMYLTGQLDLDSLVSRKLRLEEINEGFAAMGRGEVARSIVVFD
jgi:S-(hydroxymethyl)glutathione dehydrogenase / alcohol dehydrogenase